MQRTKAPFRADEVGSLLRPAKIKEARAKLEKGEISAAVGTRSVGRREPSASNHRFSAMPAIPTRPSTTVKGGNSATSILKKKKEPPQRPDRAKSASHSGAPMRGDCVSGGISGISTGARDDNSAGRAAAIPLLRSNREAGARMAQIDRRRKFG